MFEQLLNFGMHLVENLGYFGILGAMILNSNFIPIHAEIILTFAGFLASQGKLSFLLIVLAATLGDLIGSSIGYSIGYFLEETVVIGLITKYGKYLFIKVTDYEKVMNWIKKYGAPVIFIAKLTPGLKSISSIVAGLSEIKYSKFLLCVLFASLIYNTVLVSVGFYLGKNWVVFGVYVKKFELVLMLGIVIGIISYVGYKLKLIKIPKIKR